MLQNEGTNQLYLKKKQKENTIKQLNSNQESAMEIEQ
jgi:hypothetical protein